MESKAAAYWIPLSAGMMASDGSARRPLTPAPAYPQPQFTACNFLNVGAVRGAMLLSTPPPAFSAHYYSLVPSGAMEADAAQAEAAEVFGGLERRLAGYKPWRKQGLLV